jgi:hypothetical protein
MIASDQQNLELYASYARVLRQQNKIKDARQVYASCLQTLAKGPGSDPQLRQTLVWEWAWMEYLAGDDRKSLDVILLLANEFRDGESVPYGPPLVLT